jgi:hypothetical protein
MAEQGSRPGKVCRSSRHESHHLQAVASTATGSLPKMSTPAAFGVPLTFSLHADDTVNDRGTGRRPH